MMSDNAFPSMYRAFISYSHTDSRSAAWLQRAIETYRMPPYLIGRATAQGVISAKLGKVFLDRADLSAAADLTVQLTQELTHSRFLIVICSPKAASSHWVNEEILAYKRLHGPHRVLALIVAGEPFASFRDDRAQECLPPALRFQMDEHGDLTTRPAEPIAADLRSQGDGKRMALLKLIAAMTGLGLDELVRRDHQRRLYFQRLVSAAALAAVVVLASLTYLAASARDLAEQRRLAAEDLVNFMLTDLREKLEPIGRLDVLDVVAEKILDFYKQQETREVHNDALSRQAAAMHLLGEMRDLAGDTESAVKLFTHAATTTSEILNRAPNSSQAIFDHAQSVFWVGYTYYQAGDFGHALPWFEQYLGLARKLIALDPNNEQWRMEFFYALTNLAILQYKMDAYQSADTLLREIELKLPKNKNLDADAREFLINQLSWQGTVALALGQFDRAITYRLNALHEINSWLKDEPERNNIQDYSVTSHHELARIFHYKGDVNNRDIHLKSGLKIAKELVQNDAKNTDFMYRHLQIELLALLLPATTTEKLPEQAASWLDAAKRLALETPDNFDSHWLLHWGQLQLGRLLAGSENIDNISSATIELGKWLTTIDFASRASKVNQLLFLAAIAKSELEPSDSAEKISLLQQAFDISKQSTNYFEYQLVCEVMKTREQLSLPTDDLTLALNDMAFKNRCY